jgi:Histidine kinase-, DNA gyrase B-, and HSP90-like ATPase
MSIPTVEPQTSTPLDLHLTVLGRTLEHLGSQMYKRRDVAVAELVANAWDAGAKNVKLIIPEEDYDPLSSNIEILDDGCGMTAVAVQEEFLVIGRNRRTESSASSKRVVMGKKGIGKLAGFGMARIMEITTWVGTESTHFMLDLAQLKASDGKSTDMPIKGESIPKPDWCKSANGTRIVLRSLKHKTAPDITKLMESLARRFSTSIRGEMCILVNGTAVGDPHIAVDFRFPETGQINETLPSGKEVSYHYAFATETIKSSELRGFTIYVRGRTAQAPPFFFDVEGTASGQHSTKYVTGSIDADFLDEGTDDASDVISTDRQHIDWELPEVAELKTWGEALARKALRDCAEAKGTQMKDWLIADEKIAARLGKLEKSARDQISKFLVILGKAEPDETRALDLADSLVQAFEYRHFHDVISMIETASDDPHELQRLLSNLHEWKVLESRAILEIVKGRIGIIDRFRSMVVNDAPETKSKLSDDNLHDLIAGYPWLLNPEWQVLSEEKKLSTQLQEWGHKDITAEDKELRYDFLALNDEKRLVIVEIKRSGHAVSFDELTRLDKYKERLSKSEHKEISVVLVYGGTIDVNQDYVDSWRARPDARLLSWAELHSRNKTYYEHYQAVLERDVDSPSFANKEREIANTRAVLAGGSVHRDAATRKEGLGTQDVNWSDGLKTIGEPIVEATKPDKYES